MTDLEFIGAGLSALGFVVGGVVWLVRLEGKTTANTVANAATDKRLDSHVTAQDRAREEIIRLQEQIKHLTDLIERWLSPAPKRGRQPSDES